MPPQDPETARWFAEHVQPHGALLRAWLKGQFSLREDQLDDIVQEAFIRVVQVRVEQALQSPKAYLFAVARNLALMHFRHQAVADAFALAESVRSSILDESVDVPHEVARLQELEMLTQAIQSLPTRCRQVLTLRKLYGMPLREVAAELGIAEQTVIVQTAIGLKKIGQYFRAHGITSRDHA